MGSINPPKKRDYGNNTRIDVKQSHQVAYWKQRFGISEEELIKAVRAAGALARNVEAYLRDRRIERKLNISPKLLNDIEVMTEQGPLRSHVSLVAIVVAVMTFGSMTEVLSNGKTHDHTSHLGRGSKVGRDFGHGWGWDASVGFYEGPFWGRKGKGYFRCLDPVYGWHPCPFDGVLAAQPRSWGGRWHRRS